MEMQEFLTILGIGTVLGFSLSLFVYDSKNRKRLLSKRWFYTVELYSNSNNVGSAEGIFSIINADKITTNEITNYILKAVNELGKNADTVKVIALTRLV